MTYGWRWRTALLVASALGLVQAALKEGVHAVLTGERWNWPEMAVIGTVWTLFWPAMWWLLARAVDRGWTARNPAAQDRFRRQRLVTQALDTATVPSDAHPDAWRRALRDTSRELSGLRILWLVVSALVTALVAVAAVVANDNAWTVWAVAVVVATNGVLVARPATTKLRTARRLLAQLDREAEPRRP